MKRKIKILFYSGHCETVGGDAKYLLELINSLDDTRYDIKIATDKNPVFERRAEQYLKKDAAIEYLDTVPALFKKSFVEKLYVKAVLRQNDNVLAAFFTRFFKYKVLGRDIWRLIRYFYVRLGRVLSLAGVREYARNITVFRSLFRRHGNIDIFHFNNGGYPGKWAGIVALAVARFYGVRKTVMTVHNLPGKRKWYRLSDHVLDMLVSRYCGRIIVVSEKLKKEMGVRRKISTGKLVTIFCGLNDTEIFTETRKTAEREKWNLETDGPVLSITSNLDESRKGHSILFEAMVEVKERYPGAKLLVVGDGKKKDELKILRGKLKLENNVVFLGHLEDIKKLNNVIDIGVVPSIETEGIPYSILETMRAGKPVITTDVGGCVERTENGITGLVVPQNDPGALAGAILKLLDDPVLRERMGKTGRDRFKEKFFLPDKVREHERIYEQLLEMNV